MSEGCSSSQLSGMKKRKDLPEELSDDPELEKNDPMKLSTETPQPNDVKVDQEIVK